MTASRMQELLVGTNEDIAHKLFKPLWLFEVSEVPRAGQLGQFRPGQQGPTSPARG